MKQLQLLTKQHLFVHFHNYYINHTNDNYNYYYYLKNKCGLLRFRRMSCDFNFQTPTVGKMEAVTVSVG